MNEDFQITQTIAQWL